MHSLNQHELIQDYIRKNNFGRLLGMSFNIIAPGKIEYNLTVRQEHLATPVAAHGGLVSAIMDATVGVGALTAVCEEGKVVSTVSMNVQFLAPVLVNDVLTCISTVVKKGGRLIFMEAELFNGVNERVALASATLNAYPKEKAGY